MTARPGDLGPPGIDIRAATSGGTGLITVCGDVDAASAPDLDRCLLDVLARSDVRQVELDLRGVTFLDSAGLTVLVRAHRAAEAGGRELRMRCGTGRPVRRPLQLTGLMSVLTIIDR